jgi:hypothetical protein
MFLCRPDDTPGVHLSKKEHPVLPSMNFETAHLSEPGAKDKRSSNRAKTDYEVDYRIILRDGTVKSYCVLAAQLHPRGRAAWLP